MKATVCEIISIINIKQAWKFTRTVPSISVVLCGRHFAQALSFCVLKIPLDSAHWCQI